mgnify:CR=1 FL=1
MAFIDFNAFGKHVARLADGAHHVIHLARFVAADVFNLVGSLIQCRANEVGHARINDGKLFAGALFDV